MKIKHNTLWLTNTAVFIALLIALQAVTMPLGNPLITGSIVNMLLIISVMVCGLSSGVCVAILSPVAAKFFGIGPLTSLIPFIMMGNLILVLIWYFLGNHKKHYIALFGGAFAKYLVLYIGIVKFAIPVLLNLPEKQASIISNMFSISQLMTALLGGILALLVYPRLKKAKIGGNWWYEYDICDYDVCDKCRLTCDIFSKGSWKNETSLT